jgi:hypothetical protein
MYQGLMLQSLIYFGYSVLFTSPLVRHNSACLLIAYPGFQGLCIYLSIFLGTLTLSHQFVMYVYVM